MSKRKILVRVILIVAIVAGVLLYILDQQKQETEYSIFQLPMTDPDGGCCYAIELPDGSLIMIDSGYQSDAGTIRAFIEEHGNNVQAWFVTHPHFDHAGGLIQILKEEAQAVLDGKESTLVISQIYYAPFTQEFFETPEEGKDLTELSKAVLLSEFEECMTYEEIKPQDKQITYQPVEAGQEITFGEFQEIKVTCMNSFEPGVYDVNANSLVLHFNMKGTTFLITGDLTDQSVANMKNDWADSKLWDVDLIQIPHHGYLAGISSDELYRLTTPKLAFLDCSRNEYESNAVNIKDHMKWLEDLSVPVLKRFEGIHQIQVKKGLVSSKFKIIE